jgi:predicted DNA-binding transcriptional regulator YafY
VRSRVPLGPPLPLAQLLIILRTYQALRGIVPGLAVLSSDELERSLAASLPAEDVAGAARLVESNIVLMKHCLKRPPPAEAAREAEVADERHAGDAALDDLETQLQAAIDAGAEVELTYADTEGRVTQRRVHPLHLELRWGRRYLLAHCHLRDDERHFRLDRIVQLADAE